jgi:hypothetical protein
MQNCIDVRALVLASFFCFGAMTARANAQIQDPNAPVTFWGAGTDSCADYVAADNSFAPGTEGEVPSIQGKQYVSKNAIYHQWISGFLSAEGLDMALAGNGGPHDKISIALESPDFAAVDLWIKNWCEANPDKPIFSAAGAWIRHVEQRERVQPDDGFAAFSAKMSAPGTQASPSAPPAPSATSP